MSSPKTKTSKTIENVLKERQKTHGSFLIHANITQRLKMEMRDTPSWSNLDLPKREALEMIAHKLGRILAGDPNHKDHWQDIEGYTRLISDSLQD